MRRRHPLLPCLLALSLALAGCGKAKSGGPEASSKAAGVANADIKKSLQAVPAAAGIVLTMSSPARFWDLASGKDFIPLDPAIAKELDAALKKHIDEQLGLDFTALQSMVVFAGGDPLETAVVLTPVRGTLRMGQDVEGGKMIELAVDEGVIAIHSGDTLIIGQNGAALLGMQTLSGKNQGMTGTFKELVETQAKDAYLSASANVSVLPIPPNPMTGGLAYGALRLAGGKIALTLKGESETLKTLSEQLDAVMTLAVLGLKRAMEESESDLMEGTVAIISYYSTKNMAKLLVPKIKGDTMSLDLDMSFGGANGMIIVAVVGILAAVAIPAFLKYIKKSKTAEANQFLKKMYDSARMAQLENTLPTQSSEPTPPLGSCCHGPDHEKCDPSATSWQHPTWQALDFAILDPHYYSYQFIRQGEQFEVRAYGDLDCDGDYSTFSMSSGDEGHVSRVDELE